MSKTFDNLEIQSIEAICSVRQFEGEFQRRVDSAKESITAIYKKFKSREAEIQMNADRYEPGKIQDLQYTLRESVRASLEELVRGKGFEAEIAACRAELEKDEPKNDVQQLIQTMKEIELRRYMTAAGNDLSMQFASEIERGDPLTISAIENSPVPLPIDDGILEEGKKRRAEVLKPIVAKRFHLLQSAQSTISGMAAAIMPIQAGDEDEISTLAAGDAA